MLIIILYYDVVTFIEIKKQSVVNLLIKDNNETTFNIRT